MRASERDAKPLLDPQMYGGRGRIRGPQSSLKIQSALLISFTTSLQISSWEQLGLKEACG
ncbi:uncharacterized protein ARMOST_02530 [Armillaria ostoyae]|uniref:Uncharacterized protein n=1 Tax=Armillaria ostoyae TaxID=47428 RepID=A0A284QRY6_ARMOS|nr:uncharacterized protein ARMOST_02530 [Armillaria ostoyae]